MVQTSVSQASQFLQYVHHGGDRLYDTTTVAPGTITINGGERNGTDITLGAFLTVNEYHRKTSDTVPSPASIIFLTNATDGAYLTATTPSHKVFVHNGTYAIKGYFNGLVGQVDEDDMTFYWAQNVTSSSNVSSPSNSSNSQLVGGLRIKQITDHDGINSSNDKSRNYIYTAPGSIVSSGTLNTYPVYGWRYFTNKGGYSINTNAV